MKKKDIEITLEKNLLDLEHNRNFNLFLTSVILFTTFAGLTLSILTFLGMDIQSQMGQLILIVGSLISFSFLARAVKYHRNYSGKIVEIKNMLEEVRVENRIKKRTVKQR